MKLSAIVVAAGKSRRMKRPPLGKPYLKIGQRPVLAHTLLALNRLPQISEIILVAGRGPACERALTIIKRHKIGRAKAVVAGGKERSDSVYNGLKAINPDAEFVLVHDGVRPFASKKSILDCIAAARKFGAAICAVPVTPTIKKAGRGNFVKATPARGDLWEVQTPQVFRKDLIIKAYEKARRKGICATDDACLVEGLGARVKIVMGSHENIKITRPIDLFVAKAILSQQRRR